MAKAVKLPSGRWRVRTCDDGVRKSYTAETKKEAERLAALGIEEEREKRNKSKTLKEAIQAYINTCKAQGYSPSTISEYTSRLKSSYPQIIDKKVHNLTIHDIQAQIDSRAEKHTVKTVRNDFFLLCAVLAVYAPSLDLRKIKLAKRQKRSKMILSEAMPEKILSAISETSADFQIYVILSMFAGLRPSESFALRWQDISAEPITVAADPPYQVGEISVIAAEVRDEHGVYTRKAPKTESGIRTQLIDWSVFALIYALKPRGQEADKILKLKPNSATKQWSAIREALPVQPTMRLYDLRHMYATAVANSGASEEELAARMGHSTSAFSHQVYVELFQERRARVNSALSKATAESIKKAQTIKENAVNQ